MVQRKKATFNEVIAISDALRNSGRLIDNCWHYEKNFSDETIAAAIGVKVSSVANVRNQAFGRLYKPQKETVTLAARLEGLEYRISKLESALALKETVEKLGEIGRVKLRKEV